LGNFVEPSVLRTHEFDPTVNVCSVDEPTLIEFVFKVWVENAETFRTYMFAVPATKNAEPGEGVDSTPTATLPGYAK
jgi:hypothetical protein